MDRRKTKRMRNIRVAMTNVFMSLSVIAIVLILMLIAMGFSINETGTLEQSGLIQITSHPGSASVEIDGESQFSRTDFSKMLSSGNHKIKISKSGYDTWTKDLNVEAGLLTRVEWVRLFPLKPEITDADTFRTLRIAEVSDNRKSILINEADDDFFYLIDIQGNSLKKTKLASSDLFSADADSVLEGEINIVSWSPDNNHIIATWHKDDRQSWHYIDLASPKKSLNLTAKFNENFSQVSFANENGSKIWSLSNGQLRLIDISNVSISGIIDKDIEQFTNNGETVSYIATIANQEDAESKRALYLYKNGEEGSSKLADIEKETSSIRLAMGTYWGDQWIAYSVDEDAYLITGTYPSYNKPNNMKEKIHNQLSFIPSTISVNDERRIVVFAAGNSIYSIDIENNSVANFETDGIIDDINWLDNFIIWEAAEDKVLIHDFDGGNRRNLVTKSALDLPVIVSENNRWLYYFEPIEQKIVTDDDKTEIDSRPAADQPAVLGKEKNPVYTLKREKLQ